MTMPDLLGPDVPRDGVVPSASDALGRPMPGFTERQSLALGNTVAERRKGVSVFDPTAQPTVSGTRTETSVDPARARPPDYNARFSQPAIVSLTNGITVMPPQAGAGLQVGESGGLLPRADRPTQ